MNITFLVGNGFDMNLKLKTSYKDFYKYYINLKSSKDDILAKSIKEDYPLWADLELGLGEYLANISDEEVETFLDSKEQLESALMDYLLNEEAKLEITDEPKLAAEFQNKIAKFYEEFNEDGKEDYKKLIAATAQSIKYAFVNFNYTETLDKIINAHKSNGSVFSVHTAGSNKYNDELELPLHIHGDLSGDMILGVDSVDQIKNKALHNNTSLVECMIKSNLNVTMGQRRMQKFKKIIDDSAYVCMYGLSIGETDETWWKYIVEWLEKKQTNRLVIYYYNSKSPKSAGQKSRYWNKIKGIFNIKSKCTEDIFKKIKPQISVVVNSKIFTFKNLRIKSKVAEKQDTTISKYGDFLTTAGKLSTNSPLYSEIGVASETIGKYGDLLLGGKIDTPTITYADGLKLMETSSKKAESPFLIKKDDDI